MVNRTHVCDVSLNDTRASVFEITDHGAVWHEVELSTDSSDIGRRFSYFDFQDVCNTVAGVLEHLQRGCTLDSFIAAYCHGPKDTPEITRPEHQHDEDHEVTR